MMVSSGTRAASVDSRTGAGAAGGGRRFLRRGFAPSGALLAQAVSWRFALALLAGAWVVFVSVDFAVAALAVFVAVVAVPVLAVAHSRRCLGHFRGSRRGLG